MNDKDCGIHYGTVDYWVRLRVPMEQALRLYKVHTFSVQLMYNNWLVTDVTNFNTWSIYRKELQLVMRVEDVNFWDVSEGWTMEIQKV